MYPAYGGQPTQKSEPNGLLIGVYWCWNTPSAAYCVLNEPDVDGGNLNRRICDFGVANSDLSEPPL